MQDFVNMLMLVCASIAALGLGLILAYVSCRAAFSLLRIHAPQEAATPVESRVVEALQ